MGKKSKKQQQKNKKKQKETSYWEGIGTGSKVVYGFRNQKAALAGPGKSTGKIATDELYRKVAGLPTILSYEQAASELGKQSGKL